MLLVPRQLQRVGLTGDIPYYGGRLTPAQAYAASHPIRPPVSQPSAPSYGGRMTPEQASATAHAVPPDQPESTHQALQHLLTSGVITRAEFDTLQARVTR